MESGKFIQGEISYRLKKSNESNSYLGTLGEAGMLVSSENTDTLKVDCRSAMSPNVYTISFSQIERCLVDDTNCEEGICLQEKEKQGIKLWFWLYIYFTENVFPLHAS
ncbi:MAG: hypothetical protein ACI837_001680 [Crocinitomicaceae bacterium]|jgi:hypothetical protein